MGKKGKGAKKKQSKEDKKEGLPEVDKEYYDIQIGDLSKKLTRLRQKNVELEDENVSLKKDYKQLDQDRADIIAYLKRTLIHKDEEISDLTVRLTALQQAKDAEKEEYETKIKKMEQEYKTMNDHFNAELKLLTGKLNSLDEFRNMREDLVNKYLAQEKAMEEQEERHQQELYEVEKNFLIAKDKLRQDMEARLLKLSLDFQRATQVRIASTTHNVIRENIAINNELTLIVNSWQKLFEENEHLKKEKKTMNHEMDSTSSLKNTYLKRNILQGQLIDRLVYEHEKMFSQYSALGHLQEINEIEKKRNADNNQNMQKAAQKGLQLEKQLHAANMLIECQKMELDKTCDHNMKLEEKMKDAVTVVKDVLQLQAKKSIEAITDDEEVLSRCKLLQTLLELFDDELLFTTDGGTMFESPSVPTIVGFKVGAKDEGEEVVEEEPQKDEYDDYLDDY